MQFVVGTFNFLFFFFFKYKLLGISGLPLDARILYLLILTLRVGELFDDFTEKQFSFF